MREEWVKLPLASVGSRALFAAVVAAVVLVPAILALRIAIAGALGAFSRPRWLELAMRFDSANPHYKERLGSLLEFSLEARPEVAVGWFRRAVENDPENGFLWRQLAEACEFADDEACASQAFARARQLDPRSPALAWDMANFALWRHQPGQAAAEFRYLLELAPDYAPAVFSVGRTAFSGLEFLADRVISPRAAPQVSLTLIQLAAKEQDWPLAAKLWKQLVAADAAFPVHEVQPYLEALMAAGRLAEAWQVWADLRHLHVIAPDSSGPGNRVYNGNFSNAPLNAGFDWHAAALSGVELTFGDPDGPRGQPCLRVDFWLAQNLEAELVYQLVPVVGNRRYHLSAWTKSEELTSSSGVRLRVLDPEHSGCAKAETPATTATTGWHRVDADVVTCADTRVVRLALWRPHSDDFPTRISGHFWISAVSLVETGTPGGEASGARP
jgi:tetratricopeptide (TPR) repeat protein